MRWPRLSLAQKFIVMCAVVVTIGMLTIGAWVARQIESGVTQNAATTTALYVDGIISPLTQDLRDSDQLSLRSVFALDKAIAEGPISKRLLTVKIWNADGTIAYSTDHALIGNRFDVTEELERAANGEVVAGFDDLGDEEDAEERKSGLPLLEIYSPIREPVSGNVIAIAEFYENGMALQNTLATARQQSWLIVAAVMSAIAGLLMTIVYSGSKTIERQGVALEARLGEVTEASEQNQRLRSRVQRASEKVTELNERYLRNVSSELHDGPAQLLGLASLRLGGIVRIESIDQRKEEVGFIKKVLDDAMEEIRNLCRGLTLPEVVDLTIQDVIERVANIHMERTGTAVETEVTQELLPASHSIKICTYRFVQEALNNSWQHASGIGQSVSCEYDNDSHMLEISVSDEGTGISDNAFEDDKRGLGLGGLRERINSIGGHLSIASHADRGTKLTMTVRLGEI